MREIKGYIVNKKKGEITVGIPPGREVKFITNEKFTLGQKVWVAYNFVNNKITSVSSTRMEETNAPNTFPEPLTSECYIEDTFPLVQEVEDIFVVEEEWLHIADPEEGWPYE